MTRKWLNYTLHFTVFMEKKTNFFRSESDNRPMRLTHLSKYTRFSATGGTFLGMHYAKLSIFVAFLLICCVIDPSTNHLGINNLNSHDIRSHYSQNSDDDDDDNNNLT